MTSIRKAHQPSITSENDLQLEYNATKSSKTVSLSQPMIDMEGTKYAKSITLPPYSSVILMKDANPDPVSNDTPVSNDGISKNLGNTEVYGSSVTSQYTRAIPFTFTEDGVIESISIYHNGGTGNVLLGVYSNNSGKPGSLLGVTPSTAVNGTKGWQSVSLSGPVSVNSGETVWLAWVFENNIEVRYEVGTPGRAQTSKKWSGGMPSSFGTSTIINTKFSIYCSYSTGVFPPGTSIDLGNTEGFQFVGYIEIHEGNAFYFY